MRAEELFSRENKVYVRWFRWSGSRSHDIRDRLLDSVLVLDSLDMIFESYLSDVCLRILNTS